MSTTYSIVCDDCKVRIDAGHTSQGGILRGVDKDKLLEQIKEDHIGHRIRLLCDQADDEQSEWYTNS